MTYRCSLRSNFPEKTKTNSELKKQTFYRIYTPCTTPTKPSCSHFSPWNVTWHVRMAARLWRIQYSNDASWEEFTMDSTLPFTLHDRGMSKANLYFYQAKDCLFCSPHNIRNVKLRHTCKLTLILNCLWSPRHHFFSHWQNRFPSCQV